MEYTVKVSQNGGEYTEDVLIKADALTQINPNTIIVDGVEITFKHEYIINIGK